MAERHDEHRYADDALQEARFRGESASNSPSTPSRRAVCGRDASRGTSGSHGGGAGLRVTRAAAALSENARTSIAREVLQYASVAVSMSPAIVPPVEVARERQRAALAGTGASCTSPRHAMFFTASFVTYQIYRARVVAAYACFHRSTIAEMSRRHRHAPQNTAPFHSLFSPQYS